MAADNLLPKERQSENAHELAAEPEANRACLPGQIILSHMKFTKPD